MKRKVGGLVWLSLGNNPLNVHNIQGQSSKISSTYATFNHNTMRKEDGIVREYLRDGDAARVAGAPELVVSALVGSGAANFVLARFAVGLAVAPPRRRDALARLALELLRAARASL